MKSLIRTLIGSRKAVLEHIKIKNKCVSYSESLNAVRANLPSDFKYSNDRPIFICSAGWRSGSTLLQRTFSGKDTLFWGEPYDRSCIIQRMTNIIKPFSDNWPHSSYYHNSQESNKRTTSFIANSYPSVVDLVESIYAFFQKLFFDPAVELGYSNWGLKEVRFGIKEIQFLNFLYPNARFVLLTRDLNSAYLSYKRFSTSMNWYARWPIEPVFTPYAFAKHHQRLCDEFSSAELMDECFAITYEQLTNRSVELKLLGEFLEQEISREALDVKAGAPKKELIDQRKNITLLEKIALKLGSVNGRRFPSVA